MVDFPNDETLMTCGLDAWPFANGHCPAEFTVTEERLQRRLGVDHFRLPPDYRVRAPGVRQPNLKIPFVRFPQWHYCPRCGNLRELGLFSEAQCCDGPQFGGGLSCAALPERRRPRLLPVRFVAVCQAFGHIQDFPFVKWVHRDAAAQPGCRLRMRAGRSAASLSGVVIECTCGRSRTLAGAFAEGALDQVSHCRGLRPWLGETDGPASACDLPLTVVQRGASNVYFAHTASSIYLPLWAEGARRPVVDVLEQPNIWRFLTAALVDGDIDPGRCRNIAELHPDYGVSADELYEAACKRFRGGDDGPTAATPLQVEDHGAEEEQYRQAEYRALGEGRGAPQTDLFATVRAARDYGEPVQPFFSRVALVHKLRETRAFYGFSRYLPDDGRSLHEQISDLRLNQESSWLPATVVRGEGLFFELAPEHLERWLTRAAVQARIEQLEGHVNRLRAERSQRPRPLPAKFVLLHTLAHLLINQLSYECGYGSASIRERIYCDAHFPQAPMNGFLIYTASGDAEGTLGGLVRQGRPGRIEDTIAQALRRAAWCSYDPVCLESHGQGPDSCNLAACHGCAILPETSCEEGNRLLDRAVVIGLPDQPEIGFFGDYARELVG